MLWCLLERQVGLSWGRHVADEIRIRTDWNWKPASGRFKHLATEERQQLLVFTGSDVSGIVAALTFNGNIEAKSHRLQNFNLEQRETTFEVTL